jgi:hypothetical protein
MLRSSVFAAAAAAIATLLTPGGASAWGVRHVGYTHVGPYGAYHVGRTAVAGPYGYHVGGTAAGGVYGGGAGAIHSSVNLYDRYHYGNYYPTGYGYAGGYRYATPYGTAATGVYRRW